MRLKRRAHPLALKVCVGLATGRGCGCERSLSAGSQGGPGEAMGRQLLQMLPTLSVTLQVLAWEPCMADGKRDWLLQNLALASPVKLACLGTLHPLPKLAQPSLFALRIQSWQALGPPIKVNKIITQKTNWQNYCP